MTRTKSGQPMAAPITGAEFAVMRYLNRPKTTAQLDQLVTNSRSVAKGLLDRGLLERENDASVPGNPYRYRLSRIGKVVVAALDGGPHHGQHHAI